MKKKFFSLILLCATQMVVAQGILQTSGSFIQTSGTSSLIVKDASLQLEANSKITILPSSAVVVSNNIINNAGNSGIVLKATADQPNGTLIFNNAVNNPVQATVEMYSKASINLNNEINNRYKWQFFGIPLRSITAAPTLNGAYVRRWSEPDQNWLRVYNETVMTSFTGYEISQANPTTYSFSGLLENGNMSVTLTASGTIDAATNSYGYHLIANPYTAAISIPAMTFGTGAEATVYLFNSGTQQDYLTYKGISGTSPGQYLSVPQNQAGIDGLPTQIPGMQAFFVRATALTNNIVQFTYPGGVVKNTTLQRAPTAASQPKPYTIVDVKGSKYSDQLWISLDENSSYDFDSGWDGMKIPGSDSVPQIYAHAGNLQYQVYSVPMMNDTKLGFVAGKETEYQFTFRHFNHDLMNHRLWLMDMEMNISTEITDSGSVYAFNALPGQTINSRFKIVTDEEVINGLTPLSKGDITYSWPDDHLIINNHSEEDGIIQIIDVSGKVLFRYTIKAKTSVSQQIQVPPGIYLINIQSGNQSTTSKMIK